MTKNKIVLYGHFGSGNIGNDSSFEAAFYHAKQYRPDAEMICVCNGPDQIAARFGIQTLSMSGMHAGQEFSGGIVSRLKRLFLRLTDEFFFWTKRPSWFSPGDLFIVVGTGAVDDMSVRRPWHSPYELYKWTKTARMGGARVIFLSVGVGPIVNRISRFLMLRALKLADYRSYREKAAFDYLQGIGYDTTGDLLYPDLVFSLPKESLAASQNRSSAVKEIGLGLINYYGWGHDPAAGHELYREYISKIKQFAAWLFGHGFTVRIIYGDNTDRWPVQEFIEFVNTEGGSAWRQKLIIEEISNVNELFHQIAQTDIVIASRFHNVLCSLMLERPVISIGYHEKNDNLMAEMGLEKYCQHIERFTPNKLIEQFELYASDMENIVQCIHDRSEQYRRLLDEQYRNVLLPADSKTP
jgi:polysaccharide pyruvyl transferase WcaK-like protein